MKKSIKVVFNIVAWIVLIFSMIMTLLVFTADRNNGTASLFGFIPMTVESDSMKPTFLANDLIICREIDDVENLKEDDVITFWTIIDGKKVRNTHRIVEINDVNGTRNFVTRGDNNSREDDIAVYGVDIIGKWTGVKISGFGKVMSFLRTKTGFFICVLIPIALFFLFELYKLIVVIVEIKRPKLTSEDEEEIKKKAIEEYLEEQKKLSAEEEIKKKAIEEYLAEQKKLGAEAKDTPSSEAEESSEPKENAEEK
ncbi:signal peptidase I [uncultured Ruminococcus sp.]|uniref:signal peptidase I n=1 Tax=uncultured Ruminococcus sp. TaxID=165186 RepID=UPI0029428BE5|nr:signal peptidase I [uncultured Ruminococcus sp.]